MINPGMVLNSRYQLEKQIGEGGFATVFLATDLQLGRKVAVKILSSKMSQDPEFLGRFKQEARSIASFEHPNILSVYDYGEFEGDPYLVMPFVDGGTLQDRLKRGPIPIDEAAKMLEQMSSALDYAHDRGIVHRDIKPQNMLMRSDGRVLLTDFGIAKLLTSDSTNSMTRPMGTISYMAPEQFDGHVSRQSDVYALGVVLYQMVSGQLPFTGTTSQVLSGHYSRPVPSLVGHPALQNVAPATVRKIDETIQKAMAKNAHDRFHTAAEFANAFRTAANTPASAGAMAETELATPLVSRPTEVVSPISTPNPTVPPPANYPPPAQNFPPPAYTQPNQPFQATPTQPNYAPQMNYAPPGPPPAYPPQPPMTTQPQPYAPGPYAPQPPQPPAKKGNGMLFGIIGGVAAIAIIAVILVVVLGGSKPTPANPTATVVAAATPTVAATTAPANTTAATTSAPVINLTTAATNTTAAVTTAAPVTTQAVVTTAAPTTAAATSTPRPVTPTPRPTTAPATTAAAGIKVPDGYTLYKNSNKLNLEVAYPNGWKPALADDGLQVTFSDGESNFIILRDPTATTSGTVEEYNAQFIDSLKKDGWKPKTEAARMWGFAGEIWLQSSYQKDTRRAWGLFALHNGIPHAVVLTGDNNTFDDRLDQEFSKMFDTMHFLGTPVDYFTGEVKNFRDPKGSYIINYPIDKWEFISSGNVPYVTGKDNKVAQYYMYDVTQSNLSVTDLLPVYKDKLANNGLYENLKETDRYKLVNIDKDNTEQSIRFSYTYKGSNYVGELLIHKKGNLAYVGVTVAGKTADLDTMYFDLWRYTQFLK